MICMIVQNRRGKSHHLVNAFIISLKIKIKIQNWRIFLFWKFLTEGQFRKTLASVFFSIFKTSLVIWFMALPITFQPLSQQVRAHPRLLIDFGSGTLELRVQTKNGLDDGEWHRCVA